MAKITLKQLQSKYRGKYVQYYKCPFWDTNEKGEQLFEVGKVYKEIHENTELAEDITN